MIALSLCLCCSSQWNSPLVNNKLASKLLKASIESNSFPFPILQAPSYTFIPGFAYIIAPTPCFYFNSYDLL